jgi:5-methylcytosine-specific restriction endonuclease McrA
MHLARLSPSVSTSRRKPATAYHLPRRVSPRPAYYQTGIPKHRSEEAKQKFLRQRGLKRVPSGYEVDHTVPLSEGGSDKPGNMELLPKSVHHAKTAAEAKRYGWHKKR